MALNRGDKDFSIETPEGSKTPLIKILMGVLERLVLGIIILEDFTSSIN